MIFTLVIAILDVFLDVFKTGTIFIFCHSDKFYNIKHLQAIHVSDQTKAQTVLALPFLTDHCACVYGSMYWENFKTAKIVVYKDKNKSFPNQFFTAANNTVNVILKLWNRVDSATDLYFLWLLARCQTGPLISNVFDKSRSNLFGFLFLFDFILLAFPDLRLALAFHFIINSPHRLKIFNCFVILL